MKRFMLAAIAVALIAINPAATADPGSNGGYSPSHAATPQGKNNAGRRPHNGNGSNYNGNYYAGNPYQGKNNAGRRPHYGNGSGYYAGYPYRGWYGHAGYYPRPYYYQRPYYGRPYPYYAYRPVGYPGYYYGYPYYYDHHHNNNNNSDWPAYLVGGAILGSVLTNVYHNSQAQQYAPANQVIGAPQGRHLLRDLNGNCYERNTDANGNELRTELPPSQCNW